MQTFSPKVAHATGRQVTADELAGEAGDVLRAQHPGVEAGDYIVEYSSRPGVQVHEKRHGFENAWEHLTHGAAKVSHVAHDVVAKLEERIAALEKAVGVE